MTALTSRAAIRRTFVGGSDDVDAQSRNGRSVRVSPRLSIVAACYNEEAGLEKFYRRTTSPAQSVVGSDYELVLMNDGSSDRTWAIMAELVRRDPNVIAVNLSRRHGHQLAITAGAGASAFSLSIPICKIRRNCSVRCGG